MNDLRPREGVPGPLGYYWFLTFERLPDLHAAAETCQRFIDPLYFEHTPIRGLHLTLDRIARVGASTPEQRRSVATAARRVLAEHPPLVMTVDEVTHLRGAIGFILEPAERISAVRELVRAATLSVLPDAPVKDSSSAPHVTIAYPKFEGLQKVAAATAGGIDVPIVGVEMAVAEVVMVALERRGYGYRWTEVGRARLGGRARTQAEVVPEPADGEFSPGG